MKNNNVMGFKKWVKHYVLRESIKEIELNRILDKISDKKDLSDREKNYLSLYNDTNDGEDQDFVYLSKNTTHKKIEDILQKGKVIYCDLYDRDGKIGRKISKVENNFHDDSSILYLDNNEKHKLEDRFLYNIIFNPKKNQYSLQTQDEYFEKIPTSNNEN
jgi:hypothetical protein